MEKKYVIEISFTISWYVLQQYQIIRYYIHNSYIIDSLKRVIKSILIMLENDEKCLVL